jgi:phosphoesterase RecJ-like protein
MKPATDMTKTAQNKLIAEIIELIESRDNILLSSHVGPDGDSLGSQIAFYYYLKSLGKNVCIYNQGHIPHYFHGFKDIDLVEVDPEKWIVPDSGFELVIIFECTARDRIGDVNSLIKDDMDIINIDHHLENGGYGKYNFLDPKASSVGEMIHRIFEQAGYDLSKGAAVFLYIAIMTDTGRFHFASTTSEAFRIAARLLEKGIDIKSITDQIYFNHSPDQMRFTALIISRMETFLDGRVCFLTLPSEEMKKRNLKYGDMEGLVEWTMRMRDVQVGALFKDMKPDFTKISLRSKGEVDVCKVAQQFDGGGHLNAAGCHMETDLESAKKKLLDALKGLLVDDD